MAQNGKFNINKLEKMRIDINWKNGTYTFKHGNRIVTKNTLQNKKDCDNITNEINEMFNELQQ